MNEREQSPSGDCPFCKITAKEASAEIIHETESCLAFFPRSPATKGHTLVIPKRHVRDFTHTEPDTFGTLCSTAAEISKKLLAVYSPDGMNMITSAGEAASQSVMHLHVHLVPRWESDEMGKIWPPKQKITQNTLSRWADEFRSYTGGM